MTIPGVVGRSILRGAVRMLLVKGTCLTILGGDDENERFLDGVEGVDPDGVRR